VAYGISLDSELLQQRMGILLIGDVDTTVNWR